MEKINKNESSFKDEFLQCEFCLEDRQEKQFYLDDDGSTIICENKDCLSSHQQDKIAASEMLEEIYKDAIDLLEMA